MGIIFGTVTGCLCNKYILNYKMCQKRKSNTFKCFTRHCNSGLSNYSSKNSANKQTVMKCQAKWSKGILKSHKLTVFWFIAE